MERIAVMSLRDKNLTRLKLERCRWFTNAMLEMTLQSQPRDIRRAWKGATSADQTAVKAPSQLRVWKRDEKTKEEIPLYNKATGEEIYEPVLEIDAALYPVDKSAPIKDHTLATAKGTPGAANNSVRFKWEQSYMDNLFIQVADKPGVDPGHPQLFVAASLGAPNKDIAEHTLALTRSIQDRGHRISRLTLDRGYNGNLGLEEFHIPMRELDVPLVVDYKKHQKGIQGGVHGTVQVEGAHYCPATPTDLLEASLQVDQKIIDWHTYQNRLAERAKYRVRPKEKPDANGKQPMMCPAYGPSATAECPIRAMHPKAQLLKDKKLAEKRRSKAIILK